MSCDFDVVVLASTIVTFPEDHLAEQAGTKACASHQQLIATPFVITIMHNPDTPLLATRTLIDAYSYLDSGTVILQNDHENESQAMERVLQWGESDSTTFRQSIARSRKNMNIENKLVNQCILNIATIASSILHFSILLNIGNSILSLYEVSFFRALTTNGTGHKYSLGTSMQAVDFCS